MESANILFPDFFPIQIKGCRPDMAIVQEQGVKSFTVTGERTRCLCVLFMNETFKPTLVQRRLPEEVSVDPVQANNGLSLVLFVGGFETDPIANYDGG